MSEGITVDASSAIEGLKDLERKVAKSYVRKALRAGCKVTLASAKSTAPVASGVVQRNVKIRSAGVKRGIIKMIVGVAKKWFTGPAFYAAFVAFGHRIGRRQLGDIRKLVPPNDWLEKAYKNTAQQAIDVFSETIGALIEANEE